MHSLIQSKSSILEAISDNCDVITDKIVEIYDKRRKKCLSEEHSTKLDKLTLHSFHVLQCLMISRPRYATHM